MATFCLTLLFAAGILLTLLHWSESDAVLCYGDFNEVTGQCSEYIGKEVPEEDCCLNIKYGFKRDDQSPCEACRPAEWSTWGVWRPCTVSCGEGSSCDNEPAMGRGDCQGNKLQAQSCTLQECCPENGNWSVWSQWSQCSVTCGKGTWERRRVCDNPAPICGGVCLGDEKELSVCDTQQVCPTHGEWGSWKPWNECSSSCIQEGSGLLVSQSRHRECNSPSPSTNPSGRPCPGLSWEQRNCASLPFCPVDGEWGEWQKDSGCSVTCGIGRVKEKRICNNPASRHGGRDCVGSPTGQSICKTEALCPIDGQWSEWQDWDRCSRLDDSSLPCTRRVGLQNRKRECERRRNDGNLCAGPYRDSRRCYNIDNCNYPGIWSEWSEWGLCDPPCGGKSVRKRQRVCLPEYPNYPNTTQTQSGKIVTVHFWGNPRIQCDSIDGEKMKVEETRECKNVPACKND
ncbi:properdin [Ascaphus truei]|uniref:properdin n=1 Tax=Ascaphus truei TaxID=8439 RepID=UPI003F591C25